MNEDAKTEQLDPIDDDWNDIDLSDVSDNDVDESDGEDTAPKPEADPPEGEGAEEPTAPETKPEAAAEADQRFTLKHLDETKEYSREEMITLAQKGLDYDRIRERLTGKEAEASENAVYAAFVQELAQSQGLTPEALMENTRAGLISKEKGIDLEAAKAELRMQQREKAVTEREAALNERENSAKSAETEAARRQQEFLQFFQNHPDVKADEIPKEVYAKTQQGLSLDTAYTQWENSKLKAELEAERKNHENAARSAGSSRSSGAQTKADEFDSLWYDGT